MALSRFPRKTKRRFEIPPAPSALSHCESYRTSIYQVFRMMSEDRGGLACGEKPLSLLARGLRNLEPQDDFSKGSSCGSKEFVQRGGSYFENRMVKRLPSILPSPFTLSIELFLPYSMLIVPEALRLPALAS